MSRNIAIVNKTVSYYEGYVYSINMLHNRVCEKKHCVCEKMELVIYMIMHIIKRKKFFIISSSKYKLLQLLNFVGLIILKMYFNMFT